MSKNTTNPLIRRKYDFPLRRDRPSLQPLKRNPSHPIRLPPKRPLPFTKLISSTDVKNEEQEGELSQYKEFSLVMVSKNEMKDLRYHIMRLHSTKNVDPVRDFKQPLKLHRKDPRSLQFQINNEESGTSSTINTNNTNCTTDSTEEESGLIQTNDEVDINKIAPDGGARRQKKNMFIKKTKQVISRNEEAKKLRYEEYYPWVLEDFSGSNTWVGNYEAAQSETYCLFVFHGDGFKMVPVEKFYKFTPRNQYATLSLEEAEKRMADSLKAGTPRWLMKHISPDAQQTKIKSHRPKPRFQTVDLGNDDNIRRRDQEDEVLDFDDVFDDDEEAPIMEGDEEDRKEIERKVKKEMLSAGVLQDKQDEYYSDNEMNEGKIDKEGRKLMKYLRSLEKNTNYESDDDENPYASSSEEEEKEIKNEQEEPKVKTEVFVKKIITGLPKGMVVIQLPPSILARFTRGVWNPNAKRSQDFSPDSDISKRAKTDSVYTDENILTEQHVIDAIQSRSLTVKELLEQLKPLVKRDSGNRERLIKFVKKVARIQHGVLVLLNH